MRKGLRIFCWITCGFGASVALLGLWGVLDPHPNQGFEAGLFLLKVGLGVGALALLFGLALRERRYP